MELKQVYIDTAHKVGFTSGSEHFGYQIRALVADTDERTQEIGRGFLWTQGHRMRGPSEHVDPSGYQSRVTSNLAGRNIGAGGGPVTSYEKLQEINAIVVDSPETVTKKLASTLKSLSPGYLILIGGDGSFAHKDVMRSIELLGTEVVPALHEIRLEPFE